MRAHPWPGWRRRSCCTSCARWSPASAGSPAPRPSPAHLQPATCRQWRSQPTALQHRQWQRSSALGMTSAHRNQMISRRKCEGRQGMVVSVTFGEERQQDVRHEALPRIDLLHDLQRQLDADQVVCACSSTSTSRTCPCGGLGAEPARQTSGNLLHTLLCWADSVDIVSMQASVFVHARYEEQSSSTPPAWRSCAQTCELPRKYWFSM